MTIPEYALLMEAAELRGIDRDYRNHLQAWLNFVVRSEKRSGKNKTKPVYNKFEKFFNYENALKRTKKQAKSKLPNMDKFLKKKEG